MSGYTKCMKKDGNHRIRVEHQEYPNQSIKIYCQKIFPDGHLIDVESNNMDKEGGQQNMPHLVIHLDHMYIDFE